MYMTGHPQLVQNKLVTGYIGKMSKPTMTAAHLQAEQVVDTCDPKVV